MSNKRGKSYECPDMAAMMKRVARGLVRRAGEGDLEALSALADVERAVADAIVQAARAAHYGPFGYTWAQIADELLVTRQAAHKRFGLPDLDIERQEQTRSAEREVAPCRDPIAPASVCSTDAGASS